MGPCSSLEPESWSRHQECRGAWVGQSPPRLVPKSRLHMFTFCGWLSRERVRLSPAPGLNWIQCCYCADGASLLVWSSWHFQWSQPSEDRNCATLPCILSQAFVSSCGVMRSSTS